MEQERDEPVEEILEEAAEHAEQSVQHRRRMQAEAAQAEAADGAERAELECDSARHGRDARAEEDEALRSAEQAGPSTPPP